MDCTGMSFSEIAALVADNSIKFKVLNGKVSIESEQGGSTLVSVEQG